MVVIIRYIIKEVKKVDRIQKAYPGHRHAGWYHLAKLGDIGIHLVTPPLLDLAVILSEELLLVLTSPWNK